MSENYQSTTALSKTLGIEPSELFILLQKLNWILRKDEKWILTDEGKTIGGVIKKDEKFGEYIVWPGTIPLEKIKSLLVEANHNLLKVSEIGAKFNTSPQKMNLIISELGWIEKDDKRGWLITKLGKIVGGKQKEYTDSSKFYVLWPESITENKALLESLIENHIIDEPKILKTNTKIDNKESNFRDKFPATHRTSDGHNVRSRAEVIIDNYLYNNQIIHAYERKVPIDEEMYADFYIPMGKKVYIEFWGKEGDEQYDIRKNKKIEIYKKNGLNLIELNDEDLTKIDDVLPGRLRKYEIEGYM